MAQPTSYWTCILFNFYETLKVLQVKKGTISCPVAFSVPRKQSENWEDWEEGLHHPECSAVIPRYKCTRLEKWHEELWRQMVVPKGKSKKFTGIGSRQSLLNFLDHSNEVEFTKWDLDTFLIECRDCHPSAIPFVLLLLILCPWAPAEATLVITTQETLKTWGNNPNLCINTASGKAAYIKILYNITYTSYVHRVSWGSLNLKVASQLKGKMQQ